MWNGKFRLPCDDVRYFLLKPPGFDDRQGNDKAERLVGIATSLNMLSFGSSQVSKRLRLPADIKPLRILI